MTSRQTLAMQMATVDPQAWFLIRCLRKQGMCVEADGEAVKISAWAAQRPRDLDPEVLESVRCLKCEILLILRLEQRVLLARLDDPAARPRRKKWKYQ